jgi:hypothetical protein
MPAFGEDADAAEPILGTWKLNLDESMTNRKGVLAHPARPATRVFALENGGLRISVIGGPGTGTERSYFAKFDGKEYPDPRTTGAGETGTHLRLSPYLIVRSVKGGGKPLEWATWAISSDGNILTTIGWAPETPQDQNIQVYERQK